MCRICALTVWCLSPVARSISLLVHPLPAVMHRMIAASTAGNVAQTLSKAVREVS